MIRRPGVSLAERYARLPALGLIGEWRALRQVRGELVQRLRRGALTAEDRQFMDSYRKTNAVFAAELRRRASAIRTL